MRFCEKMAKSGQMAKKVGRAFKSGQGLFVDISTFWGENGQNWKKLLIYILKSLIYITHSKNFIPYFFGFWPRDRFYSTEMLLLWQNDIKQHQTLWTCSKTASNDIKRHQTTLNDIKRQQTTSNDKVGVILLTQVIF